MKSCIYCQKKLAVCACGDENCTGGICEECLHGKRREIRTHSQKSDTIGVLTHPFLRP